MRDSPTEIIFNLLEQSSDHETANFHQAFNHI